MEFMDQWKTTARFMLTQMYYSEMYNVGPLKKARLAQALTLRALKYNNS
jgi:hypothetical protein